MAKGPPLCQHHHRRPHHPSKEKDSPAVSCLDWLRRTAVSLGAGRSAKASSRMISVRRCHSVAKSQYLQSDCPSRDRQTLRYAGRAEQYSQAGLSAVVTTEENLAPILKVQRPRKDHFALRRRCRCYQRSSVEVRPTRTGPFAMATLPSCRAVKANRTLARPKCTSHRFVVSRIHCVARIGNCRSLLEARLRSVSALGLAPA